LITTPGLINVDFADVRTVMSDAGSAVMGIGRATGENRASQAAERAISSPMLESSMDGSKGVLLSVSGPSSMTLHEAIEAARVVSDHADPEADIIFGAIIDDDLGEEMKITVIAAGFEEGRRPYRPSDSRPQRKSSPIDDGDDMLDIPSFVQG
ncbi:MAG: cell division protein FtsZ, partial [Acidimicrobiia bacterium]